MSATSETDTQQLANQALDKAYNAFLQQSHVDPMTEAFHDGWHAALRFVGLLAQTPGGDGCYCAHHPDDPAHTKDCYDLIKALTGS